MQKVQKKLAFTLVELIVVIVILTVLSTIGFVAYSSYLVGVRDTNRVSNLKTLIDGFVLYDSKNKLPIPEKNIEIKVDGTKIGWQGFAGANTLETIKFSSSGIDPKDNTYFSYYLTADKNDFQIMGFLEEEEKLQANIFNKINAVDYSIRYPTVYGTKLGILTDENNTPIQEVDAIALAGEIDLATTDSGTIFRAHVTDKLSYTFSGTILAEKMFTLSLPEAYESAKNCPEGYIGVWGDHEFSQEGFCVAKYEMTYTKADAPGSPNGPDVLGETWNTYTYDPTKEIASRNDYPIVNLTQQEAIDACKAIGDGYHLITAKERMSIARQIEFEKQNWSSGEVSNGYIYNGNSGNASPQYGCDGSLYNPNQNGNKTGEGSDYNCNIKRKNRLFNEEEIWDFAGNVWEHVNKANNLTGLDFDLDTTSIGLSSDSSWSTISSSNKSLYGPLIASNETQGIGKIYGADGTFDNVIIRGGAAWDGENAGIYAIQLSLNNTTSKKGNIGFRCAYIKQY